MNQKTTLVVALFAGFLGGAISTRLTSVGVVAASTQPKDITFGTITANHIVILGDQPGSIPSPGILIHANSSFPGLLVQTDAGTVAGIGNAMRVQASTGYKMDVVSGTVGGVGLMFGKNVPDSPDAVINGDGLAFLATQQLPGSKPTSVAAQMNALSGTTLVMGTITEGGQSQVQLSPTALNVSFHQYDAKATPQNISRFTQIDASGLHQ